MLMKINAALKENGEAFRSKHVPFYWDDFSFLQLFKIGLLPKDNKIVWGEIKDGKIKIISQKEPFC